MSKKKNAPDVIEDTDLDDATGGIGLLLPAVQKVEEATITDGTSKPVGQSTGAIVVGLGDGSVRTR